MRLMCALPSDFSAVIKYASGVARSSYPDQIPAFAFSRIGCPTVFMGNIDCQLRANNASGNGWYNDPTVMVPVEDLVWESHRAQADEHGALPQVGQVGQEIYGAGLAPEMALLQRRYGSATSRLPVSSAAQGGTLQLFPRLLRCAGTPPPQNPGFGR
jgi:hypothetical protein